MAGAVAQQLMLGATAHAAAQLRRGRPGGCGRRSKRISVVAPRAVLAEPPAVPEDAVLSRVDMWVDAARPKATPKRLQTQTSAVALNTMVIRSLDYDRCVARLARLCFGPAAHACNPVLTRLPCCLPQR